jgi:phosphate transport system permease protein
VDSGSSLRVADAVLSWTVRGTAVLSAAVVVLIAIFLSVEAFPVLWNGGFGRFLTDDTWRPSDNLFRALPMVVGTGLVAGGALLLAVPLGVLSAVFAVHYAPPRLGRAYQGLLALMAGIPSVVYGFWGLVALVPLVARVRPPGPSVLAGIVVLGLMILPMVALTARAALVEVPRTHIQAAAALGLTRWGIVRGVVLPSARAGIVTGVILAMGRAIGETMAVLMVTGNVVQVPDSLFAPVRALTANIALEMAYALGDHRSALFVTGLMLLGVVAVLTLAAGWAGGDGRQAS